MVYQDIYHVIYYSQHTVHKINPWVQGFAKIYTYNVINYSQHTVHRITLGFKGLPGYMLTM